MTKITLFALAAVAAVTAFAQTPAEISIQKGQQQIAQHPDHVAYYSSLAMAYARRARETSDVQYYTQADETVNRALEISPNNFEALKVRVWLLLGRHEFAQAAQAAAELNKRVPDDITVYGYLADANAELGNYADAVRAAQWMLDLRTGNVAGLTRASYQRELHGDLSGAIELMQMAYDSTAFQETEDRAWLLTQIAHLHYLDGNLKQAERYAQGALELFPGYHYALGSLAQVRLSQNRFDEAAALFQQRYDAAPHAENLFSLAEALVRAGRKTEAAAAFTEFEKKALAESTIADNANHDLMSYYTDFAAQPQKALAIARAELARRHDVYTLDGYAWALAAAGDYRQADIEIRKALAVGVKDPKILHHAAVISAKLTPEPAESARP
jgi:tetratricopeptide (TPR) repeat protein